MKTILILAANPQGTTRLRLDREVREVDNGLRRSSYHKQFRLEQRWAPRPRDVQRALLDVEPQIVHFCGHGEGQAGLVLEDAAGHVKLVSSEALSSLFELFAEQVECVLLNACYAEVQADAIVQHVNYVIGMRQAIRDDFAIAFAVGFYKELGTGRSIEAAFQSGCDAIQTSIFASSMSSRKLILLETANNERKISSKDDLIPVLKRKVAPR